MSRPTFNTEGVENTREEKKLSYREQQEIRKKIRRDKYVKKSWFLNNAEIDCVLYKGEEETQEEKNMTCAEMGRLN